MVPTTHRTAPRTRLLFLAVILAFLAVSALAGVGLVRPTAAEPIVDGNHGFTIDSFASSCDAAGGELIEIETGNGGISESSCTFDDGVNTCYWGINVCTYDALVEPTPAGPASPRGDIGADLGGDGVFVDDRPEPTATPTTAPEPTAVPTETRSRTRPRRPSRRQGSPPVSR